MNYKSEFFIFNWIRIKKQFNFKKLLLLCIFSFSISIFAKDTGVCYQWSEGDAQHLEGCEASSLENCGKGKKKIKKEDTAFQNYNGKLFLDSETQSIYEFKQGSIENCQKELIKSARAAELTMCDNWGKTVYSANLKVGDKAYIYGKSVNVRENANSKAKKLFSPEDRSEVSILDKTNKEEKIEKLYSSYWFKISVNGKTGWVYGQFLHPDPNSKNEFISSE